LLESLYAGSLEDASRRQESLPLAKLEPLALEQSAALDAVSILSSGKNIGVIAEIKRASPSKGALATIADPAALARIYEGAGASAISVLTEQRSFLGSLDDFDVVRDAVKVPLLRKDFIATEYQILEARAHGADIVLLIAAGLKAAALIRLKEFIESLGMTAFVETHNLAEAEFASSIGAKLVGINARDLATFETDRRLFEELVGHLPKDAVKVAESAVRGTKDVEDYAKAGADCVLVGEALVTGDPESLIQSFTQIPKA
jgi:indole-3-glycerol phosphate synthase